MIGSRTIVVLDIFLFRLHLIVESKLVQQSHSTSMLLTMYPCLPLENMHDDYQFVSTNQYHLGYLFIKLY